MKYLYILILCAFFIPGILKANSSTCSTYEFYNDMSVDVSLVQSTGARPAARTSYPEIPESSKNSLLNQIRSVVPERLIGKRQIQNQVDEILTYTNIYEPEWRSLGNGPFFKNINNFQSFVAAMTFQESSFQPWVGRISSRYLHRVQGALLMNFGKQIQIDARKVTGALPLGDYGAVAMRCPGTVPSSVGASCKDLIRIDRTYDYGIKGIIKVYTQLKDGYALKVNKRPLYVQRYLKQHPVIVELLPLERWNWGKKDLYSNGTASGYMVRIFETLEQMRPDLFKKI